MAPSAQPPDTGSPPKILRVFDEIEARWREALSLVLAGDAARAQREVDAAGEILARLGEIEDIKRSIDPARLAEFAGRMARLSALHGELTVQSRRAQGAVARSLGAARQGRAALDAYGTSARPLHACDEVG